MNILFFSDNFPPEFNAAASRVHERACYWIKWGHQVTVITCSPNFPEGKLINGYKNKFYQKENIDGIQTIRVKTFIAANKGFVLRILDSISYTIPATLAALFQKKPDLIVATSPSLFAAIAGLIVARIKRCPFVLEVSDLWPASIVGVGAMRESFMIRCLEKLELFLYRKAKEIIVLSPAFKNNLISRNIQESKVHVVMNGVDMDRYSPRQRDLKLAKFYNIHPNHFIVGYIGTHGMAHALENVLNSAELLKHKKNIHFIFVGAGANRENLIEIAKQKALSNVSFIPSQAKALIADYWSLCNISLVHLKKTPVFADVIPSKIFEAMGMGIPIIMAAPSGFAMSLVEEEKIGAGVPAEEPQLLAEKIEFFYNNPEILKTIAKTSTERAPKFSRKQQAKSFLSVLYKAIQSYDT
jgi:colanic acid biosynthesis glycosyl transferase WcaI